MSVIDSPPFPPFPGAVGITGLEVYDWEAVDGLKGGSPHLHTACTECYVVVSGVGRLQTLSRSGFDEVALAAGDVVWFTPGTIHRAISDAALRVVVVMQNGGLPEAGDAVLTFPDEDLSSVEAYRAASSVFVDGRPDFERARARRDLAIEGFLAIADASRAGDPSRLEKFLERAAALVRDRAPGWAALVEASAATEVHATLQRLRDLAGPDGALTLAGTVSRIARPAAQTPGMCGRLTAYDAIRSPEGAR